MEKRKPRLLIIGNARHGKDTAAEIMRDLMGLTFVSSSVFVGEKAVWPFWGEERYVDFDAMFADRVNYRKTWGDLIEAYNTPDKARTGKGIMSDNDMYVGIRRVSEYEACIEAELFDYVIWVDACGRLPKEARSSNEMEAKHADIFIDNNGPIMNMEAAIENLQRKLDSEGFDVGLEKEETEDPPAPLIGLTWKDKPENATQVLDHGFFEVKSVMGTDLTIADSARMSYGRGTKKINTDEGLINYLVRNHHTSPLEMGEIKFHMRVPIFVMRQLVRHRTANLNEYSGRYSEMVRLFYVPQTHQICYQDTVNKQGSAEPLKVTEATIVQRIIKTASNDAFDHYEDLLARNVARETARIVLPLNTYTETVWKLDVSNLIKFLYLRDSTHAQWEIRAYAKLIAEAVQYHFPLVYAAYEREKESISLTQAQIKALLTGEKDGLSKSETHVVEKLADLYLAAPDTPA